jgi:DNA-binding CsgD family transcriptional regulator
MRIHLKREKLAFTKREAHIIHLILNGYSLVEISRRLLISIKTVQSYVNIILHKLNATKISEIYRCKSLIIDSFQEKFASSMRYGFFLIHYPSINDKEKGNVSGDIASRIL